VKRQNEKDRDGKIKVFFLKAHLDVTVNEIVGVHVLQAKSNFRQEHARLLLAEASTRRGVLWRGVDTARQVKEQVSAAEVPAIVSVAHM
jgi:hypothetical protein